MTDKRAELKQHLEASRQILLEAIQGMSGDDWSLPVQSDGDHWTATQMIRHLQDAHKGLFGQAERILAGQESVPQDFDIDRWNARVQTKTTEMTPAEAIENLKASHDKLLRFVDSLKDEDFAKTGWQPYLKKHLPLHEFLQVIGSHEAGHAREIAAAVKK